MSFFPSLGIALCVIMLLCGTGCLIWATPPPYAVLPQRVLRLYSNPDVKYFVINLPRSTERLRIVADQLARARVTYDVVEAVDVSKTTTAWPCLAIGQGNGTGSMGLQLSNLKIFKSLKAPLPEWIGIFEDDAKIPVNFNEIVKSTILQYPAVQVINLDTRGAVPQGQYSGCCTACVLYNRSVVDMLIKELDPATSVHLYNTRKWNTSDKPCLFDFYLFDLLKVMDVRMVGVPVIGSGDFESTIEA